MSEPHSVGPSISIEATTKLLNVSRRTIYYHIREGKLETIRTIGGSQRVLLSSIQQWYRLEWPRKRVG